MRIGKVEFGGRSMDKDWWWLCEACSPLMVHGAATSGGKCDNCGREGPRGFVPGHSFKPTLKLPSARAKAEGSEREARGEDLNYAQIIFDGLCMTIGGAVGLWIGWYFFGGAR